MKSGLTGICFTATENLQSCDFGKQIQETDQAVREIGKSLLEMDIPRVITGHCTGDHQTNLLAGILGDRLEGLYTGLVMDI